MRKRITYKTEIPDGIIQPDTAFAYKVGFTSDKFEGWLWKSERTIIVSMIISKHEGRGKFRAMINKIKALKYDIFISTPSTRMREIALRNGFVDGVRESAEIGPVEGMEYKAMVTE